MSRPCHASRRRPRPDRRPVALALQRIKSSRERRRGPHALCAEVESHGATPFVPRGLDESPLAFCDRSTASPPAPGTAGWCDVAVPSGWNDLRHITRRHRTTVRRLHITGTRVPPPHSPPPHSPPAPPPSAAPPPASPPPSPPPPPSQPPSSSPPSSSPQPPPRPRRAHPRGRGWGQRAVVRRGDAMRADVEWTWELTSVTQAVPDAAHRVKNRNRTWHPARPSVRAHDLPDRVPAMSKARCIAACTAPRHVHSSDVMSKTRPQSPSGRRPTGCAGACTRCARACTRLRARG